MKYLYFFYLAHANESPINSKILNCFKKNLKKNRFLEVRFSPYDGYI